jgi:mRNA-degrading endonuclease RelE of RelBE toxin-antitoxin system
MYALEITPEFRALADPLHPKRYKQVHLRVFALEHNPRPPNSEILDINIYRIRVGPYRVTYEIDDARQRVRVYLLEERETQE